MKWKHQQHEQTKKKKRTEKIKEFKIMTERKRETLWYCLGGEKMEKGA